MEPFLYVLVDFKKSQQLPKKYKDQLPGGKGDKKTPKDFPKKELLEGIKVEMEHTNDRSIALEIAIDHLSEDREYYKKLRTIHHE